MKYCFHCGAQIEDDAVVCVKCGCQAVAKNAPLSDQPSTGFTILSFFEPLIGLILYIVWRKDSPRKAAGCGVGALVGFLIAHLVLLLGLIIRISYIGTLCPML